MESEFSEFNKATVTGQIIKSRFDKLLSKQMAILVRTLPLGDATSKYDIKPGDSSEIYNSNGIKSVYKCDTNLSSNIELPLVFGYTTVDLLEDEVHYLPNSTSSEVRTVFINYGEILGGEAGNAGVTAQTLEAGTNNYYMGGVYNWNGEWWCTSGFCYNGGMLIQNGVTTNIYQSNALEYIKDTAKYDATFLKDASGMIMGVVFIELNK